MMTTSGSSCPTLVCVVHSTSTTFSSSLIQDAEHCVSAFCHSVASVSPEFAAPVTVIRCDPAAGAHVIVHQRVPQTVQASLAHYQSSPLDSSSACFHLSVGELRERMVKGLTSETTTVASLSSSKPSISAEEETKEAAATGAPDHWRCLAGALLVASTIFHRDRSATFPAAAGRDRDSAVTVADLSDEDDEEGGGAESSALLGVGRTLPTPPPHRIVVVLTDGQELPERDSSSHNEEEEAELSFVAEAGFASAAVHLSQQQVVVNCFRPLPSPTSTLPTRGALARLAAMTSSSGGVYGRRGAHPSTWLISFFKLLGTSGVERRSLAAHQYVSIPVTAPVQEGAAEGRRGRGLGWLCSQCMIVTERQKDEAERVHSCAYCGK